MDTLNNQDGKPKKHSAENMSGELVVNPFENKQPVEKDMEESKEAVDEEQQFKEAHTERE